MAYGNYDALILVSFGGPEGPDDVMPFLENVLRGRDVPRARMLEVAEHYQHFGGKSPINDQNRALIASLKDRLAARSIDLPIYWGNRNWHPFLPDTLREMADHGIKNALAWFTSLYSSYSGCRQYRENLAAARETVGDAAPHIDRLRLAFNHPKCIAAQTTCLAAALEKVPTSLRADTRVLFTAHSIPLGMANNCAYAAQLAEVVRLLGDSLELNEPELVYQSRSGPPHVPWLEPDVCDAIRTHAAAGVKSIVVAPIGFVSDHMEVLYDLDDEAAAVATENDVHFVRAATVGTHPDFVDMIVDLIVERADASNERPALGDLPPNPDVCPEDCCLPSARPRLT